MKKILSLILASVILTASAMLPVYSAYTFIQKNTYQNQFSDVSESDWFFEYVKACYEYGLMKGSSETAFSPSANLTLAEALTIATRIRCLYTTGNELSVYTVGDEAWYIPYARYAIDNGMIGSEKRDYTAPASRSDVAKLFANALPSEAYAVTADYPDNSIPDVPMTASYSGEVYKLYRAGILSGSDASGTFNPDSAIKRSEIATICVRVANPEKRIHKSALKAPEIVVPSRELTATEISEKCAEAVFYVETYSRNGKLSGSASGFFISEDGYALTNHHVVADAGFIEITMLNGKKYHCAVAGYLNESNMQVVDYDSDKDLALLKIDDGKFPYIKLGDSRNVKQGQNVYALGSPMGLQNTLSQGIISQPNLNLGSYLPIPLIQISVPIAHGSSGGVLINSYGEAIGITTGGIPGAEADLNWAVPIHEAESLRRTPYKPSDDEIDDEYFLHPFAGPSDFNTYPLCNVPDFGAFSGAKLLDKAVDLMSGIYRYDVYDFHDAFECDAASNYSFTTLVYQLFVEYCGYEIVEESEKNEDGSYSVYFSNDNLFVAFHVFLMDTDDIKKGIYVQYEFYPVYYEIKGYPKVLDFGWFSEMDLKWEPETVTSDQSTHLFFDYDIKNFSSDSVIYVLNEYMDFLGSEDYQYMVPKNGSPSPHYTSVRDNELRMFVKGKYSVGIFLEEDYISIVLRKI